MTTSLSASGPAGSSDEYFWWHSIDLGDGTVTPGAKTPEIMRIECASVFGPVDVEGRSVLDVGTWNGGFAVEAKRRGARRVLATDSYCWRDPRFRGREGFDLAVRRTGLDIEALEVDATQIAEDAVGRFDVTLFLGVFYHLLDPIAVLQRLAALTDEVLVLETHVEPAAAGDGRPAMVFYPGTELNGDPTNWWGPNRACVEAMLRTFGFAEVAFAPGTNETRGLFHAWKHAGRARR